MRMYPPRGIVFSDTDTEYVSIYLFEEAENTATNPVTVRCEIRATTVRTDPSAWTTTVRTDPSALLQRTLVAPDSRWEMLAVKKREEIIRDDLDENGSLTIEVDITIGTPQRQLKETSGGGLTDRIVRPLIIQSLTYLDPESLRQVCLLSQEFYAMVHNHSEMKQRMYDVLLIRPSDEDEQDDDGRFERLSQQLYQRHSMLQLYRTMKFICVHQFGAQFGVPDPYETFELNGIVTLDMSSPTATEWSLGWSSALRLGSRLARLLPNLREMNLSNLILPETFLRIMSETCVDLEIITWNNMTNDSTIHIDGTDMRDANNLTEICMDNAVFWATSRDDLFHPYLHQLSDMENTAHAGIFLFHKCSNKLERVSIRHATYVYQTLYQTRPRKTLPVPQNALIKFIRNAPSTLKCFCSDLTPENMTMLRSERPEIELLN